MQLILKLDVVDDGNVAECTEIWRCDDVGASLSPEYLGLSLADGKTICAGVTWESLQDCTLGEPEAGRLKAADA